MQRASFINVKASNLHSATNAKYAQHLNNSRSRPMDTDKYNRSVPLQCPTCGATQFIQSGQDHEESQLVRCTSCGRELTQDDLIRENSENLSEHANEIAKQAVEDFGGQLKKSLIDAFKGNEFIKIK